MAWVAELILMTFAIGVILGGIVAVHLIKKKDASND